MGKKASAKKRGRALDQRGYATVSVASIKKEADKNVEEGADAVEEAQPVGEPAEVEGPADRTGTDAQHEEECEDWERLGEDTSPRAEADAAKTEPPPEAPAEGAAAFDEEWEKAVESRLDDELQKLERRFIPTDATAQLERRGGAAPAGVVVLSKAAEQQLEAALTPLRDEEGLVKMTFPRHWRYKGKLTYERLNGIYLALESLNFKGEQIRWAMEKTLGYDMRSALELLLVNIRKDNLPRQFGGEGTGDTMDATQNGTCDGGNGPHKSANSKAEPEPGNQAFVPPSTAEAPSAAEAAAQAPLPVDPQPQPCARSPDECGAPPEQGKAGPPQTEERGADFMKKWMTQYCQASDSDSDELLDPEERLERERRQDPTARFLKISRQFDELMKVCKALKEKKKHGSFKQNISSDMQRQKEANARMSAIKIELEHLERGKYGKLDRSRIDRELAARQKNTPATAPVPAEKSEGSVEKAVAGGSAGKHDQGPSDDTPADEDPTELPSLFDAEVSGELLGEQPPTAADSQPPCRAYNIAGWSGRTPKQNLEEFVRKRIWGKQSPANGVATYQRVQVPGGNRHTARVGVHLPRGQGTRHFDPQEACESIRDAEHLAATFALMKLSEDADRPGLCRGLPPAFKQRWQEWEQEAASRLREARRELARNRIVFLERMLRTKPSVALLGSVGNNADAPAGRMWADPSEGEQFVELSGDAASKLRASFAQRQEALKDDPAFAQIQQVRSSLPVADYRESFVRLVKGSGVVVVSGATGSGKTTQVPQFVLEDALAQGGDGAALPNIIVTEPRRISAVSVAKRVSQELGDPPGGPGARSSLVGYHIRLERRVSESTRLLFCTVGVLLKQMQQGLGALSRVTHVFLDEVHERSAECDLLLLLLRQIRSGRPDLRIVLMSATMEVEKLVRYFGSSVPVLTIPGRTFPVESFWLEDVVEATGYRCEDDSEFAKRGWGGGWGRRESFQVSGQRGRSEKITAYLDEDEDWACDDDAECCDPARYSELTGRTLSRMDHSRINYDLIEEALELIEGSPRFRHIARDEGAVLVFLPGLMEITKVHERLTRSPTFGDPTRCLVLSLHSVLSGDEHAKAFERPRRGVRKIVLSTNIAETGVTIPDVVFVIDSGKVKSQRYHEPSNTSSLKEQFISRAEVMQRRGRAGRVREGYSFHLLTRSRFELRLQEMPTPEILRCSLMELMLSVLSSGLQPSCFAEALDPPPKLRIDQAVATLKATGAVEEGTRPANAPQWGTSEDVWYVTTPIGQCLARLPCDLRLGKMVLFAALFGGTEAVWTVAAALSHRSPLVAPFSESKRAQARNVHCAELLPKDLPASDHFALNTAFVRWDEARRGRTADSFCRKSWLNNQVLQTIRDIRNDLIDSLRGDGFCERFAKEEVPAQDIQSPQMMAALIFAGLYPNVARVDAPKVANDKMPILSAGSEQLKLHPGSLCHGRLEGLHRTNHRWICYHTKVKTSQVFMRDCTFLTPNALLLFGGDTAALNVHPVEKSVSIGLGGEKQWHTLYVTPRSAAMIRQLRYSFEALLRRKATDPRKPLRQEDRAVIVAYIAVVNSVDCDA